MAMGTKFNPFINKSCLTRRKKLFALCKMFEISVKNIQSICLFLDKMNEIKDDLGLPQNQNSCSCYLHKVQHSCMDHACIPSSHSSRIPHSVPGASTWSRYMLAHNVVNIVSGTFIHTAWLHGMGGDFLFGLKLIFHCYSLSTSQLWRNIFAFIRFCS